MMEFRVMLSNALRHSEAAMHVGGRQGADWAGQALAQLDQAAGVIGRSTRTGLGIRIAGVEPMRMALGDLASRPQLAGADVDGVVRTAAAYGRAAVLEAATIGGYSMRPGLGPDAVRAFVGPASDNITNTVKAAFWVKRP